MKVPAVLVEFREHFQNIPIVFESFPCDSHTVTYISPIIEDDKYEYSIEYVSYIKYNMFDNYISVRETYFKERKKQN